MFEEAGEAGARLAALNFDLGYAAVFWGDDGAVGFFDA